MNYGLGAAILLLILGCIISVQRANPDAQEARRRKFEGFQFGDWVVYGWGRYSKWTVQVHVLLDRGLREYRVVRREMTVEMRCRDVEEEMK
jgi:hypothetical protein